jgi:hypothetical protein
VEIIDQNLGANFSDSNSASDNDLPGYNKTDEEGVDRSRSRSPLLRARGGGAVGLMAVKVAH